MGHTGAVHREKERIVRESIQNAEPGLVEPPQDGTVAWFREGADQLLTTLQAADPSTAVHTWYADEQTVGFWYRRMAQETAVHRVDAELGHGIVGPVEPMLAADGVDELLAVFASGYPDWSELTKTDRTLRLEPTDSADRWTVRLAAFTGTSPNTGNAYENEATLVLADDVAAPSAVARGTSSDLLLFAWGRAPAERLEVTGDASVVVDFRALAADVTQ